MNTLLAITLILCGFVIGGVVGYVFGHDEGYHKGYAEGTLRDEDIDYDETP